MKVFLIGCALFILGGVMLFFNSPKQFYTIVHLFHLSHEKIYSIPEINNDEEKKSQEKIYFTLYYDFSCPYCSSFYNNTFFPLQKKYEKNINFIIVPYAINSQGKSFEQAQWFVCLHDEKIGNISSEDIIKKITTEMELKELKDVFALSDEKNKKVLECVENEETEKKVREIREQAKEKGVRGTPTFFIGDEKFEKNQSLKKVELQIIEILQQ